MTNSAPKLVDYPPTPTAVTLTAVPIGCTTSGPETLDKDTVTVDLTRHVTVVAPTPGRGATNLLTVIAAGALRSGEAVVWHADPTEAWRFPEADAPVRHPDAITDAFMKIVSAAEVVRARRLTMPSGTVFAPSPADPAIVLIVGSRLPDNLPYPVTDALYEILSYDKAAGVSCGTAAGVYLVRCVHDDARDLADSYATQITFTRGGYPGSVTVLNAADGEGKTAAVTTARIFYLSASAGRSIASMCAIVGLAELAATAAAAFASPTTPDPAWATWSSPGRRSRLVNAHDIIAALLNRSGKLDTAGEQLAGLSDWIDAAPRNDARDPEARTWGRLAKIAEEAGEVVAAYIAATGQNPRKGAHGSLDDVGKELLDVAVTALCAYEHLNANNGSSLEKLFDHIAATHIRAGLSTTENAR